jgi:hypothetical protein
MQIPHSVTEGINLFPITVLNRACHEIHADRTFFQVPYSKTTIPMLLTLTSIPTPNDVRKLADPYVQPIGSHQLA